MKQDHRASHPTLELSLCRRSELPRNCSPPPEEHTNNTMQLNPTFSRSSTSQTPTKSHTQASHVPRKVSDAFSEGGARARKKSSARRTSPARGRRGTRIPLFRALTRLECDETRKLPVTFSSPFPCLSAPNSIIDFRYGRMNWATRVRG